MKLTAAFRNFANTPKTCTEEHKVRLMFAWPCIIDINNIDNQLDATITVY